MKSVLISIIPKYCEYIARGRKTVEVRKTRPNIIPPFKCYIYETKDRHYIYKGCYCDNGKVFFHAIGKVIGEFVCNRVEEFVANCKTAHRIQTEQIALFACIPMYDLLEYGMRAPSLFGWHISDLKIYDKPKELSEFSRQNTPIKRPPQSWCYVEA